MHATSRQLLDTMIVKSIGYAIKHCLDKRKRSTTEKQDVSFFCTQFFFLFECVSVCVPAIHPDINVRTRPTRIHKKSYKLKEGLEICGRVVTELHICNASICITRISQNSPLKKAKKANKHSYYRLLKRKQGPEPLRLNAAHQSFFRV